MKKTNKMGINVTPFKLLPLYFWSWNEIHHSRTELTNFKKEINPY